MLHIAERGEITKRVTVHVETGTVFIAPASYIVAEGGKPKKVISVPKGEYTFTATVGGGDMGWFHDVSKLKAKGKLSLPDGLLVVDDPCYSFRNYVKWNDYLNKTKLFKKLPSGVHVIDTGGDGKALVTITLTPVK